MSLTPSRRGVLQAALLGSATAACTYRSRRAQRVDPDDALRAAAVARERSLVALYEAAAAATPGGSAAAILAEHQAHLRALGAFPDPSPSQVGPSTPPAVADLVTAERAAAAAHAAAAVGASRELAAVLASLAASEASHPVGLQ
jgi:hypothetical protein